MRQPGSHRKNDRIIEIGAILLERDEMSLQYKIKNELSVLIKQDRPLPEKIIEITNITDDMLETVGITEAEAFARFNELMVPNCLLVAYNIQFDYGFISALYQRVMNHATFEIKK